MHCFTVVASARSRFSPPWRSCTTRPRSRTLAKPVHGRSRPNGSRISIRSCKWWWHNCSTPAMFSSILVIADKQLSDVAETSTPSHGITFLCYSSFCLWSEAFARTTCRREVLVLHWYAAITNLCMCVCAAVDTVDLCETWLNTNR